MDMNKNKLVAWEEPNYSFYGILPHKARLVQCCLWTAEQPLFRELEEESWGAPVLGNLLVLKPLTRLVVERNVSEMFLCWVSCVRDWRHGGGWGSGMRSPLTSCPAWGMPQCQRLLVSKQLCHDVPRLTFSNQRTSALCLRTVLLNEQEAVGMGNHAVLPFCYQPIYISKCRFFSKELVCLRFGGKNHIVV